MSRKGPLALAFGLCRVNVRVKIVSSLANMGHLDRVSREIVVRGELLHRLGLSLNNQDQNCKMRWIVIDSKTKLVIYDNNITFKQLGVFDWDPTDNPNDNRFLWAVSYANKEKFLKAHGRINNNCPEKWMFRID